MLDSHPTTFAFVQYHLSDDYQTTWGDTRAAFYDAWTIPASHIDGVIERVGAYSYADYESDYLTRRAVTPDVTIDLSAMQVTGPTIDVSARVCVEAAGTAKSMRIYIVQVLNYYPASPDYHRDCFRQAAATQDVLLGPGQCEVVRRTLTLDTTSWDSQADIALIAWAQEPKNSGPAEVFQAAMVRWPFTPDCNHNGTADATDIGSGTSQDCNANGVPDECEVPPLQSARNDCNANRVPDECDIAGGTSADCNADGVPDECERSDVLGTGFDQFYSWAAYNPGANGVGTDPEGYCGAVFDGRYVYFVPNHNRVDYHGEVLRYDTTGAFAGAASWATYDPGAHGVGTDPDGYRGGVFDGRYIYFAPRSNGTTYHGEVLRYDTTAPFAGAASWATYDAGANGVGTDPDGYAGAVFDGRYVYFAPSFNGAAYHGEVLRYDATAPFGNASSWSTYDPGAHGVGTDPDGYSGVAFDGRYLYFSPYHNGSDYHGEVLRYDTAAAFAAATSWSAYDPGAHGVGIDPDGYSGVVFDGRYLYFSPHYSGSDYSGEVLRYDTAGEFAAAASWGTFDPGAHGVGSFAVGFEGALFDGRFVYLVPLRDAVNHYHGEVLRYDTAREFAAAQSWNAFEPHQAQVGAVGAGYCGGVFDGRHLYFAPYVANDGYHGEVLRYDTRIGWDCDNNGLIDDCEIAAGTANDVNHNGVLDRCEGVGDVNCDRSVDFDDIQPFVLALVSQDSYESQYPNCRWLNGDIDSDGRVTFDDIGPFVDCLVNNGCR